MILKTLPYFLLSFPDNGNMTWNKFKIAQTFLQKANAIHPEEEEAADRRDQALALQNVYYECYMSSFSRDDLVKRLQVMVNGNIEMPEEEDVNESRYRDAYMKASRDALAQIEQGDYDAS